MLIAVGAGVVNAASSAARPDDALLVLAAAGAVDGAFLLLAGVFPAGVLVRFEALPPPAPPTLARLPGVGIRFFDGFLSLVLRKSQRTRDANFRRAWHTLCVGAGGGRGAEFVLLLRRRKRSTIRIVVPSQKSDVFPKVRSDLLQDEGKREKKFDSAS